MKAMLLAAGRGLRMGSITDTIPKPLLKVGERCFIERHIDALVKIGVNEIVINIRHLADKIIATLGDGSNYGVIIHYSDEQELCLNTGGGINRVLPLLGAEPFILVSSDIVTAFDFATLPTALKGLAHLVMVNNPGFHPEGDFGLDPNGWLTLDEAEPKLTYGNIAVIDPRLFAGCKNQPFSLAEVLYPAIRANQITGEHFRGFWENVGTAHQLEQLKGIKDL